MFYHHLDNHCHLQVRTPLLNLRNTVVSKCTHQIWEWCILLISFSNVCSFVILCLIITPYFLPKFQQNVSSASTTTVRFLFPSHSTVLIWPQLFGNLSVLSMPPISLHNSEFNNPVLFCIMNLNWISFILVLSFHAVSSAATPTLSVWILRSFMFLIRICVSKQNDPPMSATIK